MATSFYTVVQYLPNPIIDERINIGVIVFGDDQIRCRFVQNWQRVRQFGKEDVTFLQNFAKSICTATSQQLALTELFDKGKLDEDTLKRMTGHWINSIQFAEPRASLQLPEALLADMTSLFLREPVREKRAFRDRRVAASMAADCVRFAVRQRAGIEAEDLVKRNYIIQGHLDEHKFDVAVANGKPFMTAQGLSFEGQETNELSKDVDATAWAIDDVKRRYRNLPLAIFALPPRNSSKTFDRAMHIFEGLDASVFHEEEQVSHWAQEMAKSVPILQGKSY